MKAKRRRRRKRSWRRSRRKQAANQMRKNKLPSTLWRWSIAVSHLS
jgi:hypothetical protein